MTTLRPSKAPNLPVAPVTYAQQYQDQILNTLRLYFNQVDNFTSGVIVPPNGKSSERPTTRLLTGQYFFDTTLGIPIWWNGIKWINASGTAV
jgi:hypothetical protein